MLLYVNYVFIINISPKTKHFGIGQNKPKKKMKRAHKLRYRYKDPLVDILKNLTKTQNSEL